MVSNVAEKFSNTKALALIWAHDLGITTSLGDKPYLFSFSLPVIFSDKKIN